MTRPQLCQTVTATTMADLIAARDAAVHADLVELRLDGVTAPDVAGALADRRHPVIVTCRPVWEGGRFDGSEEERLRILSRALAAGAEYVDVEFRADEGARRLAAADPERVLISAHDFTGVPADLEGLARAMRSTGARRIKVAVMAGRLVDVLPLRDIGRCGDAVVIGMGDAGMVTRMLPARFGSLWSYGGHAAAPGQIPAARMVEAFRFRDVGPDTRIFGVVSPFAPHSFSPLMHNAAFGAAGIDGVYVPLAAADFADFLAFADAMRIEGVSVTIPYKLDALAAADTADPRTRAVGAANTLRRVRDTDVDRRPPGDVVRETGLSAGETHAGVPARSRPGSGWEATNTDVDGFLAPLVDAYAGPLTGVRAAVLGAGGAARAVVAALQGAGAVVSVHARRDTQAAEVAHAMGAVSAAWPPAPGSWDLLVNTTPLGGANARDQSPLPHGPFDGRLVYDLTYGPGVSRLLADASAAGCRTLDGLPMLVAQAERQFEWWTGVMPQPGVMRAALERRAS